MNNSNDFTYDKENFKGLPEFVRELHSKGMHYIPLIDPGVSASELPGDYPPFDVGLRMDIFVKNSTGQIFIGKVSFIILKIYKLIPYVLPYFHLDGWTC